MNICKLVFTFLFIENCHLSVVLQDLGWDTENAEHAQGLFFFFCIYLVDLLGRLMKGVFVAVMHEIRVNVHGQTG